MATEILGANGTNLAGVDSHNTVQVGLYDASGTPISASNPIPVTLETSIPAIQANITEIGGAAIALGQTTMAASLPVAFASNQSALTITAVSLPLPTGASTSALQSAVQSAPGTPQTTALTIQGNASGVAVPVSGTVTANAGSGTFAISASTLPLPTGAATAASQTNVQSAIGSSATTAITIQGAASGVAVPISGSVTGSGTFTVVGAAGNGSAVSGNPVLIAGYDGTNARTVSTDTSGHQIVVGTGTFATQSTVTQATASSLNATVVGAGTAGTPSGGVVSIQGVASGTAVPISGSITGSGNFTVVQPTAASLNATVVGTGTFATQSTLQAGSAIVGKVGIDQTTPGTTNGVQTLTGSSTAVTQATAANLNATVVGTGTFATQTTLQAGSAIAGKFGIDQTTPGTTNAVSLAQIGATTVLAGAGASGAGAQRVAVAQDTTTIAGSAPGTAGTPSANVLTVQGATGATPLPIYQTVTSDSTVTGGNITVQDTGSTTSVGQYSQVTTTGTATAGSFVLFAVAGNATATLSISNTWTGTIVIEGTTSPGGVTSASTWTNKTARVPGTSLSTSTFTANVTEAIVNVSGYTHIRVRATAAMTGTATVSAALVTLNLHCLDLINPIRLVDGTGTTSQATVKAASTAPLSTDTSLVVALSPNSSLPQASLPASFADGRTTVTTAGTAVQFASQAVSVSIMVKALSTNAGIVYIGNSSGVTSANGYPMSPGEIFPFNGNNLNLLWANAASSGDGFAWAGN